MRSDPSRVSTVVASDNRDVPDEETGSHYAGGAACPTVAELDERKLGLPHPLLPDLHTAEVAPWPRIGQKGALVCLAEQEQDDGWLVEIDPGGQTEVLHHLFETTIYVVEGRGATTIWQAGSDRKQTVEWQTGS